MLGDEANKPLVVRLDGNNVEEGRRILNEANHPLVTLVDTMDGAADRAAELAATAERARTTMAIFLTESSKVVVQGMTGSEGQKHTRRMLASGTNIVGGVNPRKAGQSVDFDGTVRAGVRLGQPRRWTQTGADVSVVFVPPAVHQGRGHRGRRRRRCRWSW